jgi:hypothetical protein
MADNTASAQQAPLTKEQREAFLIEYQKAQDSAQHHDTLVWTILSLNWVGSAILMGFVLSGIDAASCLLQKLALLAMSAVGVALSALVWRWAYKTRCVKVAKYKRCIALEALFEMQQHSCLSYTAGSQTKEYAALMILFLLAWVVLIINVIVA